MLTADVKRRRVTALDGDCTAPLRAVPDPGPPCPQCGAGFMVRTGTCLTCSTCGHNTGCGDRRRPAAADAEPGRFRSPFGAGRRTRPAIKSTRSTSAGAAPRGIVLNRGSPHAPASDSAARSRSSGSATAATASPTTSTTGSSASLSWRTGSPSTRRRRPLMRGRRAPARKRLGCPARRTSSRTIAIRTADAEGDRVCHHDGTGPRSGRIVRMLDHEGLVEVDFGRGGTTLVGIDELEPEAA